MFLQINDIDRNIYMIASIVRDGTKVIYKMINGTQLQEVFDTEQAAEAKYEEAIEMTGGGSNIPLDPDGKIPAEYLPSYVDDVEDLLAVSDTAPATCSKGDKYYNTTSKKIFTASATDTWGSTGEDPEKDKIYVNTADDPATSWRWSGTDLVMIGGGSAPQPSIEFLGRLSEHNTQQTAIDITNLNGFYAVSRDTNGNLYLEYKYNGTFIGGYIYFDTSLRTDNAIIYLDINIPASPATGSTLGSVRWTGVSESSKEVASTFRTIVINSSGTGLSLNSGGSQMLSGIITSGGTQTVSGKKTFSTLPESSVVPTTNDQLVNKKYVDDSIGLTSDRVHYLGMVSSHKTAGTALDISDFEPGLYLLYDNNNVNGNYDSTQKLYINFIRDGVTYSNGFALTSSKARIDNKPVVIQIYNNPVEMTLSDNKLENLVFVLSYQAVNYADAVSTQCTNAYIDKSASNYYIAAGTSVFPGIFNNSIGSYITSQAQTFSGVKTFNSLPESSAVPTTDNQLVNKKYVDDNAGGTPYYLGNIMNFNSSANALDFTDLDVGEYAIGTGNFEDTQIYIKVNYKGSYLETDFTVRANMLAEDDILFIVDNKLNDDTASGTRLARVSAHYIDHENRNMIEQRFITFSLTDDNPPVANINAGNGTYWGTERTVGQYTTMPMVSNSWENIIVQYVGATGNGYTQGYFYVCVNDGSDNYSWTQINVQPQGSGPSPSPDLPTNGVRLLKKAANSVQALGLIDDPAVDDACLVLTDEVVEHRTLTPIELENGIEANTNIVFGKDNSFTFTGDVSNLLTVPDMNMVTLSDGEGFDYSTEWLGFGIAGPNPLDNKSWYFFEFIAGPSSPAAELRGFTGIINAWVCEDPANDPTFVYVDDGEAVAQLLDSFGYDVYEYGMTEYTTSTDLVHLFDSIASSTQGQYTYKDFVGLTISKEDITTETYKKSDLYTYDGSQWVYRDRNLSANANWEENDPTAPGYVRGRTHYVIPGSGEDLTTIDLSDDSIYTLTEGQPVNPDNPEKTQAGLYTQDDVLDVQDVIDFYDKLEVLYNEGYSSSDKTFTVEYGSRRNQVYTIKEEVPGDHPYIAYYIIGKDEQQETYYDGDSDLGFEFGVIKDYQGSEFIGYYVYMSIYTEIYEAEDSCRVLSIVEGSKDQVVKLDSKFIPQLADWNENDTSSPRYIANRTHYKEGTSGKVEDLGNEDFGDCTLEQNVTTEGVDFYQCSLDFKQSLEDPDETEGNIEAERLFDELERVYIKYGQNVDITIKVGELEVSGKLLFAEKQIDTYNRTEVFFVATDGGELDPDNLPGTVMDLFQNNSSESKGVLLAVSRDFVEIQF